MSKSQSPKATNPAVQPSSAEPAAAHELAARRPGRRIGRRGQLIGLLLIVVVVGAAAFVGQRLLSGSSATASQTVWQNITSGIRDDGVPKDVALEAFAYLYHVNIPGVTVPQGVSGSDAPTSGSGALRWVKAHWKELTSEQQAVINRFTTAGPNDIVIPIDLSQGATTAPSFTLAASRRVGPAQAMAGAPSPGLEDAMKAELITDIKHIGERLNMPVINEGALLWTNVTLTLSDESGGGTLFQTFASVNGAGHYSPCNVTAYKEAWENETAVSSRLHVLMTHEVIHCYQNVIWGDVDTALAAPAWITEGTALYLAADDTGIAEPMIPSMWENGYFKPETPLTNRSYDAFGYYSLLNHLGRPLWSLMVPGWKAAAASSQRSNAFVAVIHGDDQDVRDGWASSYLNKQAWGDPWVAYGFGLPDSLQVFRHPAQATPSGYAGTLQSRANTVLDVTAPDVQVVTITTSGLASVHDESGHNLWSFETKKFCTSAGDCVCPSGSLRAGENIAPDTLTLPFALALNAPSGGSTYAVIGHKLDDECGRKATPPPSGKGSPCTGKCAGSNGDPHLLTINNYRYDFQGAGEFTLLRSKDGSLEIQSRQEPYASTGVARVATNTALAAKVGAHRVGVYATAGGLGAKLDGAVLDLTKTTDLGGGARIAPYTKGLEIDFPDGTRLWALSVGQWGINAQISPSDALRSSGVGLLGTVVPGGLGVPALPDGTRLPIATDRHARHDAVYGRYADAWRITDATSLFDYDSGKTTASYTQKGFPVDTADVTYGDLTADQRASGGTACATITDQQLQDDCVFDVGVSGQSGFADGYVAAQALYDSGIAAPSVSPSPQSSESAAPGQVTGAVAITQAGSVMGAVVGPDGKLYFSIGLAGGKSSLLEVDPTTGKIVHQVDVPAATTLHVAAGSVWAAGLIVDSSGNNCNTTRFDAQTLALQVTIPIPCAAFGPTIASDGDAIWYEDISKWDAGTEKGAVLVRLDPTTNLPGTTVALPFINGYYHDSQGALFVWKTDLGLYRLTAGGTTMEPFGQYKNTVFAAGAGFWVQSDTDKSALHFTTPDSPDATVQIGRSLVGGDASAAYADVSGPDGTTELWRYPMDGSAPTQIGMAPTVDGDSLSYFADPQPLPAPNGVVKYWLLTPSGATSATLYLQWLPLP